MPCAHVSVVVDVPNQPRPSEKESAQPEEVQEDKKVKQLKEVEEKLRRIGEFFEYTGELPFSSLQEVTQFVKNSELKSCAKFWDIFSIMSIMDPRYRVEENVTAWRELAQGFDWSLYEFYMMTFIKEKQPKIHALHNGNPSSSQNDLDYGFFGSCKSYDEWAGVENQLDGWLYDCLETVEYYIRHDSDSEIPQSNLPDRKVGPWWTSPHEMLALMLLEAVRLQFDELRRFIRKFYKQLTAEWHVPKDQAWSLVGRYIRQIFSEMHVVRGFGIQAAYALGVETLEDKQEKVIAPMLWSALLSCEIFNKALDAGFIGHHAFQKEIMSYSFQKHHEVSTKTDSLVRQQNAAKERIERQEAELQSMRAIVNGSKKKLTERKT